MQPLPPELGHVLMLPLAIASFLLPGWVMGRWLGTPFPVLTMFLGSAAILFNTILLLDATGVPLHFGSVGLGLALWCVLPASHLWKTRRTCGGEFTQALPRPRGIDFIWLAPVAVGVVAVVGRATLDPLSGWDNGIRWDYLARLMLTQGSLEHYPAVSAEDFLWYGWSDGIPPLVPMLNFWIYAVTGSVAPALTAPRVISELVLTGVAVFALSQRFWGPHAGWPALAALASSSLVLWAIANGQETGLLTLSLVTLVLLLGRKEEPTSVVTAGWAGVAAGVGAISRDYGLAFILIGGVLLCVQPCSRRSWMTYLVTAGCVAGPWYVRNWILTGNPLYPHTLGGIFPGNLMHNATMSAIKAYCNVGGGYFRALDLPVDLAITMGVLGGFGLWGLVRLGHSGSGTALAILAMIALWWWALPLTAGGWVYAQRVLTPGLALLAACVGGISLLGTKGRILCAAVLSVAALDAGRRMWLLPQFPQTAVWPYTIEPWRAWQEIERSFIFPRNDQLWTTLVELADGEKVLVDHPAVHAEIRLKGGSPVPWFSPEAAEVFSLERSFDEIATLLRQRRFRYLVLDSSSPIFANLNPAPLFFQTLVEEFQPNLQVNRRQVYDLSALIQRKP